MHLDIGRQCFHERGFVPVRPVLWCGGEHNGLPAKFAIERQAHAHALAVRCVDRRKMRADDEDAFQAVGAGCGRSTLMSQMRSGVAMMAVACRVSATRFIRRHCAA